MSCVWVLQREHSGDLYVSFEEGRFVCSELGKSETEVSLQSC